jgi:hypothetical protein
VEFKLVAVEGRVRISAHLIKPHEVVASLVVRHGADTKMRHPSTAGLAITFADTGVVKSFSPTKVAMVKTEWIHNRH